MAMSKENLSRREEWVGSLTNVDIRVQLKFVKDLVALAQQVGARATREDIIPCLTENIDNIEDEILFAMAEELGKFIELVGGIEYADVLLNPLKKLCTVEEIVVRDKAVESLHTVGDEMKNSGNLGPLVDVVKELANGEWFTSKVSACDLLYMVYPTSPQQLKSSPQQSKVEQLKAELQEIYSKLCHDDLPMVRRAAASNLGKFAAVLEEDYLKKIVGVLQELTRDEQDSVRVLAVEGCAAIEKLLQPEDRGGKILTFMIDLTKDTSWRVRYMVANYLHEFCVSALPRGVETERTNIKVQLVPELGDSAGPSVIETGRRNLKDLVDSFVKLLHDNEAEVRIAAAGKVAKFCHHLQENLDLVIHEIIPCVKDLSTDTSQHVRSVLASVIVGLAPILSKDDTEKLLLPIFDDLMNDKDHEVSLNLITKLSQVDEDIRVELLSSMMFAIRKHADNGHWRVRAKIMDHIPLLVDKLRDTELCDICIKCLEDKIFSIRDAAAKNLGRLAKAFGPDWTTKNIIPQVLEKTNNKYYLYRLTSLQAISLLAAAVGNGIPVNKLLPVVIKSAKDKVPNVRFKAAEVLQSLVPYCDSKILQYQIKPCLDTLINDDDEDVKDYANKANEALQRVPNSGKKR